MPTNSAVRAICAANRWPAAPNATLEITDGSHCDMPFGMSAQDDGVYYTDLSENRIERTPPTEPYTGLPVVTPAAADLPGILRSWK